MAWHANRGLNLSFRDTSSAPLDFWLQAMPNDDVDGQQLDHLKEPLSMDGKDDSLGGSAADAGLSLAPTERPRRRWTELTEIERD
jgi:hypothetical protein